MSWAAGSGFELDIIARFTARIQDVSYSLGTCLQRPRHELLDAAAALQSNTALGNEGSSGGSDVMQLGSFFPDLDVSV